MDIGALTGLLCGVIGAALSYLAFTRNQKHDADQEGRETGEVLTELRYIRSSIDSIIRKMDKIEERNQEIGEKLVELDQSVRSAHRRINSIEDRLRGAGSQ